MDNVRDRITRMLERWFIDEPLLFRVACVHELVENRNMACPVRCGRRTLEYNPEFLDDVSDVCLDEMFKTEAIRILLKHPYERKPDGCSGQAVALGSNVVIGDGYKFRKFQIETPETFQLESGMPYEWYSRKIQEMLPPSGGGSGSGDCESDSENPSADKATSSDGSSETGNMPGNTPSATGNIPGVGGSADRYRDLSGLWEEDDMAVSIVNGIIDGCKEWGSIPGQFAEKLMASTKAKIDWRKVFSGFRASVICEKRKLTRMRPNRRSGFDQMGSTRKFTTKLLVAVDVSGSISSKSLSYFYGVINSAFRYGFDIIDTIQFDCGIQKVESLSKATREVLAIGRGGTSFQEPIDYANDNGYDGLVILTDGYAPEPDIPMHMNCKIIWVCDKEESYNDNYSWMSKIGRVCTIQLV